MVQEYGSLAHMHIIMINDHLRNTSYFYKVEVETDSGDRCGKGGKDGCGRDRGG